MSILSGVLTCVRYLKKDNGYIETSERTQAKDIILADGGNAESKITSMNASVTKMDSLLTNLTDKNKITSVKVVSTLPANSSSNPTTLYIVLGS